jgi:hypothetical protein
VELKPSSKVRKKSKSDRYRKQLEAGIRGLLEPGEELKGIAAASWKKGVFSTAVVALAVTDRRLIIQPLGRRKGELDGEARSLTRAQVEKVKADRPGGFADTPSQAIMDSSTIDLKVWTEGGEKLKFQLMHGEGMFGFLGGGASQQNGVQTLLAFLGEGEGGRI